MTLLAAVLVISVMFTFNLGSAENCNNLLDVRLPTFIRPSLYDLFLHPKLEEGVFTGNETIFFRLKQSTHCIPVHIFNLDILFSSLHTIEGKKVPIKNAYKDEKQNFLVIQLLRPAHVGKYYLMFKFAGNLTHSANGFYRSGYSLPNSNSTTFIATTKFEPVAARQAFPCFDEPSFKAQFDIKVVRPRHGNYIALSNGALEDEVPGPGKNEVTATFQRTVPMSTYLVAFVISDFVYKKKLLVRNKGGEKFPLRVYAPKHLIGHTSFSLYYARQVLEYFIKYYNQPYPLPKLDLIAIPDFESMAMENWGLITFRDTALLYNKRDGNEAKKKVARTVAHELAHQWFGNLVTMKWWDDLWLNEGFARFMQFKGMLNGFTEGKKWKEEGEGMLDVQISVMKKDGLISSHPIVQSVYRPSEINEIFDIISYGKGGAILNMFENWVGENNFRDGVRHYLERHQYSNAASSDLWDSMTHVLGPVKCHLFPPELNLSSVMATWTKQMGLPLVVVRKYPNGKYVLTQTRYLDSIESNWAEAESPFGYKWDIPICYRGLMSGSVGKIWLLRNSSSVEIHVTEPIKLNCDFNGYFRVRYPKSDLKYFVSFLIHQPMRLSVADRINLLDDAFHLAHAGYIPFARALRLFKYLKREQDHHPLEIGLSHAFLTKSRMTNSAVKKPFSKLVRGVVRKLYNKHLKHIKWNLTQKQISSPFEYVIFRAACKAGLKQCRKPVIDHFKAWINRNASIVGNLRSLVYVYGMRYAGTEKDWNIVWSKFVSEMNPHKKTLLLRALCFIKNEQMITKILRISLQSNPILRDHEILESFNYIAASNKKLVWNFYKNNYEALVAKFSTSSRAFGRLFYNLVKNVSTPKGLKEVKSFIAKYPNSGTARYARKKALEQIEINIGWRRRNLGKLDKYLKKFVV